MAKKKAKSAQAAKLLKKSKLAKKSQSVAKKSAKAAPPAAKKSKKAAPPAKKPGKTSVRPTEKKSRVTEKSSRAVVKKSVAPPPKPVETPKPEPSLGRPLVTQEEKLYMLFHDDYQSRQVFEFLQVETLKQLEAFSPQQIVYMMSKPIRMTVDRIRQRLAQYKRSLKDDEHFAAMVQEQTNAK